MTDYEETDWEYEDDDDLDYCWLCGKDIDRCRCTDEELLRAASA